MKTIKSYSLVLVFGLLGMSIHTMEQPINPLYKKKYEQLVNTLDFAFLNLQHKEYLSAKRKLDLVDKLFKDLCSKYNIHPSNLPHDLDRLDCHRKQARNLFKQRKKPTKPSHNDAKQTIAINKPKEPEIIKQPQQKATGMTSKLNKQEPNNNNASFDIERPLESYDLTDPAQVFEWAKRQGIPMSAQEVMMFVDDQRNQKEIQRVIAALEMENQADVTSDCNTDDHECFYCFHNLHPHEHNVVPVSKNCIHKIHSHCLNEIKTKFTECPICRVKI